MADYCKIGDITLDNMPIWIDEMAWTRVRATIEPTLTGMAKQYRVLDSDRGRKITLESREDTGWLKKSTVIALKADEEACATSGYTRKLDMYCGTVGYTASVIYRSDEDGGGVNFQPVVPVSGLATDDWYYYGQIKLMVW